MEEGLDRVQTVVDDRRAFRRQSRRARGRRHGAAIDLCQKVRDIVRLKVDDMKGQGLVHACAHALADGILGPHLVPPADLGDVDDVGDRVVLGLEAKVSLDIAAARVDRVGGADVRRRSHRGDVACHGDERAR